MGGGGGGGGIPGIPPGRIKTRPCNKFNTPAGCPYGDRCTFLHAEAPMLALPPPPGMEFAAPGAGMGRGRGRGSVPGGLPGGIRSNIPGENVPLNYRTRLCMRFDSEAVPFVAGGPGGGVQPCAPDLAENMVLAHARAACVNPRNSPWVRSGGSDVYGDNIMAQLM